MREIGFVVELRTIGDCDFAGVAVDRESAVCVVGQAEREVGQHFAGVHSMTKARLAPAVSSDQVPLPLIRA